MQVVGLKGQGAQVLWGGQSFHVTLVATGNAAGRFIEPTLIYQGKRKKSSYTEGFPSARLAMTASGYMEKDVYAAWAEDFVKQTGGNCILVVDNHSTRKDLHAMETWLKHNVTVVTLPPHTTHVTQPLDVAFFRPLKTAFRNEFMVASRGKIPVTKTNLAGVLKGAWDKATLPTKDPSTGVVASVMVSGFEATGIVPLNPGKVIRPDVVGLADELLATRRQAATPPAPSPPASSAGGDGPAAAGAGAPSEGAGGDDDEDDDDDVELELEDGCDCDETAPLISPTPAASHNTEGQAKVAAEVLITPEEALARLKAHNAKSNAQRSTILTHPELVALEVSKAAAAEAEAAAKIFKQEKRKRELVTKKEIKLAGAERRRVVKAVIKGVSIPAGFEEHGWADRWDDEKGPGVKVRLRLKDAGGKSMEMPVYNVAFRRRWKESGGHGAESDSE